MRLDAPSINLHACLRGAISALTAGLGGRQRAPLVTEGGRGKVGRGASGAGPARASTVRCWSWSAPFACDTKSRWPGPGFSGNCATSPLARGKRAGLLLSLSSRRLRAGRVGRPILRSPASAAAGFGLITAVPVGARVVLQCRDVDGWLVDGETANGRVHIGSAVTTQNNYNCESSVSSSLKADQQASCSGASIIDVRTIGSQCDGFSQNLLCCSSSHVPPPLADTRGREQTRADDRSTSCSSRRRACQMCECP